MKKIAILTSGGDSAGMNAAIITITKLARKDKYEVYYVRGGYIGLYRDDIVEANKFNYQDYINNGGSFIWSARFPDFPNPKNYTKALANLKKRKINKLIVIGGDGSYQGALRLSKHGPIICGCLPGTIDNDVVSTKYSIGFDSALNVAVKAIKQLRCSMKSHDMCTVVELMGRRCSDLAIYAGIATHANVIITHENKLPIASILSAVKKAKSNGERGIVVVLTEYIYNAYDLAKQIQKETGISTRACILGHTQRGASPSAMETFRATLMAWTLYEELKTTTESFVVGWNNNQPAIINIKKALRMKNKDWTKLVDEYNEWRNL